MSRSKRISFTTEVEIEVTCSIYPGYKGQSVLSYFGPTPDEPPEVVDLYVGVIIKGTAIDITSLLNKKQAVAIEEECFLNAEEEES